MKDAKMGPETLLQGLDWKGVVDNGILRIRQTGLHKQFTFIFISSLHIYIYICVCVCVLWYHYVYFKPRQY